jgi:hypothetical protein
VKAPPDGINLRKKKPYKTCAECRAKGDESARRRQAADKAEVAEATGAAVSAAQPPFCVVWDVHKASAEAEGLGLVLARAAAFTAVWDAFPRQHNFMQHRQH